MPLGPTGGRIMAEIVAAALAAHAPLITGKPDIARPEQRERISASKIPGAPKWGSALLEAGLAGGFDFAYSYEIESWDELSVPLHFLNPEGDIPVATVYTNCAAPPLPTLRRCHDMGA